MSLGSMYDRAKRSALGFTVHDDGTIERRGVFGGLVRSPVLDVSLMDNRARKSFLGRAAAGIATGGVSLTTSGWTGYAAVVIVTEDWSEIVRSKDAAPLQKLYGLARAAQVRAGNG